MKEFKQIFILIILVSIIISCDEDEKINNGKAKPENTENHKIGYIQSIIDESGKKFIKIDFIDWFNGLEAGKAMKEDDPKIDLDELGGVPPDDYYIRNTKTEYEKIQVINDVKVRIELYKTNQEGQLEDKLITLDEFKNLLNGEQKQRYQKTPFWVEIKNGVIQSIEEQFIP